MKPLLEGCNVVIAGAWNARIFTPDWIIANLTECKEVTVDIPLGNPTLQPRIQFGVVRLIISNSRLVTSPVDLLPDSFEQARLAAKTAAKILSHTPVSGVGVNFKFLEENPNESLVSLFNLPDINSFSRLEIPIEKTIIQRILRINDLAISITLSYDVASRKCEIDTNTHKDITIAQDAAAFLEAPIEGFRNTIYDMLGNLYELTVE